MYTNTFQESKWKSWKPYQLKEKKHRALLKTPQKNISKDGLNKKIDVLTDSRNELVKTQTKIAEQEKKQNQELGDNKLQFLNNGEERQKEAHNKLMANLNLQHDMMLQLQATHKRQSELQEKLLLLEIQKMELEIKIKQNEL